MNTFGEHFRVTTWGASHDGAVGCVIDGCPSNLFLDESMIQPALDRRKPGQSELVSSRKEKDQVQILSGVFEGKTTGGPIALIFWNHDVDSSKYENIKDCFRPNHADYTYYAKYGHRDWRGGGRASARETLTRVAAGAVAKAVLKQQKTPVPEILAWVSDVGNVSTKQKPQTRREIEQNSVRCPDPVAAEKMKILIQKMREERDSIGGAIRCVIRNVSAGLGDPVFGKLEAELAKAMLSIPASKGFEIGSGFESVKMRGSEHNDPFIVRNGQIRTLTNHSGGIQGGISNGETILFRVAFKPTATIFRPQQTVDLANKPRIITMAGRHDPCVVLRAAPVVEAMAWLTLINVFR